MDKNKLLNALKSVKEASIKRNFSQSYDLIVNLKNLDLKKPEEQIELFVELHYNKGKENKICGLVGPELKPEAAEHCDFLVEEMDFDKYAKDKNAAKKLASEYDFFIAQANVMPKVAGAFGRVFGPKKKMPNPKAGCVVPPKAALGPLCKRLKNTVKAVAKEKPIIQVPIGNDKMKDEEIIDNIITVYNQLIHKLPNEKNNIRSIFFKLTMGKPVQLEF